ncbi:hypothetical protein LMH73_011625 [Vibrio splendidus]|nr:hypothetical protein [Vibrio splendidus]MCC4883055.1 hypothetical protein [Vibrio splendidus]
MVETIITEKLVDPQSLAVILLQLSRKHSYHFEEDLVDRSKSIRDTLKKRIMSDAEDLAPHVTQAQWSAAAAYLVERSQ